MSICSALYLLDCPEYAWNISYKVAINQTISTKNTKIIMAYSMIILVQCRPSWISDHHQKTHYSNEHIMQQLHQPCIHMDSMWILSIRTVTGSLLYNVSHLGFLITSKNTNIAKEHIMQQVHQSQSHVFWVNSVN